MSDSSSKKSTQIVLEDSLQHPLTLLPSAVGILGTLSGALFGLSGISAGIAVGGLAIGASHWAFRYFWKKEFILQEHALRIRQEAEKKLELLLAELETQLGQLSRTSDPEGYAEQAQAQFLQVREAFRVFRETLLQKLNPGEFAYARYLATAEQVYLAVLENIKNLSARMVVLGSIDSGYLHSRIKELGRELKQEGQLNPADQDELKTLEERRAIHQSQLEKINETLTFNEQALTRLASANASIVEMRGKGRSSDMDLESATRDLEELARRASRL